MRQKNVMTKEEQYISEHGGGGQPFRAPSGYFEQLTERVMLRVDHAEPAEVRPLRYARLRRTVMWAAAASVAALVAVNLFTGRTTVTSAPQMAQQSTVNYDIDALADYTMVDDDDLIAMMTE